MIAYVVEVCHPIPEPYRSWAQSCWRPWREAWRLVTRREAVASAEWYEERGYRARIREVP